MVAGILVIDDINVEDGDRGVVAGVVDADVDLVVGDDVDSVVGDDVDSVVGDDVDWVVVDVGALVIPCWSVNNAEIWKQHDLMSHECAYVHKI